ncbi:transposase [Chroococcidiopsidales cyanobacterium LEGE 13417]|nr:transposase [Chroococcidiopsidales cyanobacterium LEGE 13417]
MKITYKYKLKPTTSQISTFSSWLELCRRQYNFRLGQRFDWYDATRSRVDACPLVTSIVSVEEAYKNIPLTRTLVKGKRKGEEVSNILDKGYVDWFNIQRADLKQTKTLFPDYKVLDSQVLQDVIDRVETAFSRFTTPDINGNRSGKPRFKGKHYYKSFTYTQLDNSDIVKDERGRNCVNLKKIGLVPLVLHRQIPDGLQVKTGTIIKEADAWYISLVLEDKEVPVTVAEIQPTKDNSIGIDLGVENYIALSSGETVEHPRFFYKLSRQLHKLQKRLAKATKHSKLWKILKVKIAKVHQHIARSRLDWQFKLAYWLFTKCDVLFVEDLKLKNLTRRCKPKIDNEGNWLPNGQSAKSGLNKSMLDAAHGQFVQVLKFVAWKLGKVVREIDPRGTSQHCWNCLNKVSKELKDRWHSCLCGEELHRDDNSAKLIKKIGLVCSIVGTEYASLKTALELMSEGSPRCAA